MADEVKDTRTPPPSWLDKDFIQTALRAGDRDSSITVLSCDVRMANAVGDGYGSDMYRVTAELQDAQRCSVIVKCHPQGGKKEEVMKKWQAFEKEIHMFTKTLPAIHNLLEQARPGKYKPFSAKCLHVGQDPVTFLVLEDLKQSGFNVPKKQLGLDLTHSSLAITTLARFHAASLALYEQDPSSLEYYDEGLYRETLREDIAGVIESSIQSVEIEVAKWPGYEKYTGKLKTIRDSSFDRLVQVCKRKEGAFNCLIHGDPWTSNMMFKYSDGSVEDFRLVDFQTAHYSSPALDLQYFLHTSATENVYADHIVQLLEEYHDTFNETLNILACPKHQISLDDLRKEFDKHIYFAFFASTTVLPVVLSEPEDGYDIEESLKNKEMSVGSKKIYSGKAFVKAIKILLPIFESKGLL